MYFRMPSKFKLTSNPFLKIYPYCFLFTVNVQTISLKPRKSDIDIFELLIALTI